jgi:hypothetical protein
MIGAKKKNKAMQPSPLFIFMSSSTGKIFAAIFPETKKT